MQLAGFAGVLGLTLTLGACAGAGGQKNLAQPDPDKDDFDADKVAAVTQWAHIHGATEVWVNYPTKHRPRDSGG